MILYVWLCTGDEWCAIFLCVMYQERSYEEASQHNQGMSDAVMVGGWLSRTLITSVGVWGYTTPYPTTYYAQRVSRCPSHLWRLSASWSSWSRVSIPWGYHHYSVTRQRYFLRHCTPGTWFSWGLLERTQWPIGHDLYKISVYKGFDFYPRDGRICLMVKQAHLKARERFHAGTAFRRAVSSLYWFRVVDMIPLR